jgi:hypothetical protein
MCPACLTTAALIAASLTSTGGLAMIAIRKFGAKSATNPVSVQTKSQEDHHG